MTFVHFIIVACRFSFIADRVLIMLMRFQRTVTLVDFHTVTHC